MPKAMKMKKNTLLLTAMIWPISICNENCLILSNTVEYESPNTKEALEPVLAAFQMIKVLWTTSE